MNRQEFVQEAKRRGHSYEETKAQLAKLDAEGVFDVRQTERPEEDRAGSFSGAPEENFDLVRPQLLDGVLGESAGRSFDAGVMGMADQLQSFGRGIQDLNPFGSQSESELDAEAAASEKFADSMYGSSNPIATTVGEFAASAPTMALPGRLPAQIAYGAGEAAIDHRSNSNAGVDALVGGATTGIFGTAFDFIGRALTNGGRAVRDGIANNGPDVPGQARDETKRLIEFADNEGVNMTPAQRTRERRMMQTEARMSSQPYGQKLNDIREQQIENINQMVFDRFGIDNATSYSPQVANAIDQKIGKAFKDVEEAIPTTSGDEVFLEAAKEVPSNHNLNKEQTAFIDDLSLKISDGMDGKTLMDERKKLQKSVQNNLRGGNGDFADALYEMVDHIDDLIVRSSSDDVAAKYSDVRDMSRMRMVLERGASVSPDGDINAASFSRGLQKIYRKEFARGAGHSNPATERVFDAARLGSMLNDKIGNSGTATRESRGWLDRISDKVLGEPSVDFYLNNPRMYGLLDPMGDSGRQAAQIAGREASFGSDGVNNLLGIREEDEE